MSAFVLDASGLLAFLQDEEGASEVEEALASGAAMSSANLAEVLAKLAQQGLKPDEVMSRLEAGGVLDSLLEIESLTVDDAVVIAEMHTLTRDHGLGLGDHACLALGRRLRLPVMTADRVWVELEELLDVQIYAFRS